MKFKNDDEFDFALDERRDWGPKICWIMPISTESRRAPIKTGIWEPHLLTHLILAIWISIQISTIVVIIPLQPVLATLMIFNFDFFNCTTNLSVIACCYLKVFKGEQVLKVLVMLRPSSLDIFECTTIDEFRSKHRSHSRSGGCGRWGSTKHGTIIGRKWWIRGGIKPVSIINITGHKSTCWWKP